MGLDGSEESYMIIEGYLQVQTLEYSKAHHFRRITPLFGHYDSGSGTLTQKM